MPPDPPSLVCLCKLDIHVTPLLKILPTGLNSVMVNSCTKALKPRVTCRFSVTNQLLQAFADKYDCQDGTLCVQYFAHPFPTFLTRVAALLGTIKWKGKIREQNKCYRVQCMQQIWQCWHNLDSVASSSYLSPLYSGFCACTMRF